MVLNRQGEGLFDIQKGLIIAPLIQFLYRGTIDRNNNRYSRK